VQYIDNCKFPSTVQSVPFCLSLKFNNTWKNNLKPLFAFILVRILLRLFPLNFYEVIVDSAFSLINQHLIEISSS